MCRHSWILLIFRPFVFAETMEWGINPNMVDEAEIIQGREHIKAMVVMVSDNIDLTCQVGFTSHNVSEIIWKIDGKTQNKTEVQTEDSKKGEVFVEDHLKIYDITEDMDGSTVSCEYSKGYYGGSVEVILRVYKLKIELSGEACDTQEGEAKLMFSKCKESSPADENVQKRIVQRIADITNKTSDDIQMENSGYSVVMTMHNMLKSEKIFDLKPTVIINDENEHKELGDCKTPDIVNGKTSTTENPKVNITTVGYVEDEDNATLQQAIIMLTLAASFGGIVLIMVMLQKYGKSKEDCFRFLNIIKQRERDYSVVTRMDSVDGKIYCKYCSFNTPWKEKMEAHMNDYKIMHADANTIVDFHTTEKDKEIEKLRNYEFELNQI